MPLWIDGVQVWESVTLKVKTIFKSWLGLDNSLGPDMVTNGAFASDTAWTKGTGWSIAAGVASHGTNGTGALEPSTALSVVANGIYEITYDVTYTSGTGVVPSIGGTNGVTRAASKTGYIDYIKATDTTNLKFTCSNTDRIDIDNVVCKLVATAAADRATIWVSDQGGAAGKGSIYIMSEDGTLVVIGGPNGIELWPGDTIPGLRIFNAKNPLEYLNIVADTNVFQIFMAAAAGGTGRSVTLGNNRGSDYLTLNADGSVALISKNNGNITLTPNGSGKLGIGVTPTNLFHVAAANAAAAQLIEALTGTNAAYEVFKNTGGNMYVGRDNSTSSGVTGEATSYDCAVWIESAHALRVGTNNATRLSIMSDGKVGIGVAAPAELLHVDDAIAISNDAEGSTGRLTRRSKRILTAALSGATVNMAFQIPSGARLLAAQFCVNTLIEGATSWSAAFNTGSTTSLGSGYGLTVNTKVDQQIVDEKTTALTDITLTAAGSNFTAGVIEGVVYYEELTSMANV